MDTDLTVEDGHLIREATTDDAPTVYGFLCELEEITLDRPTFDAIFARNLADPSVHYRVAQRAETVVGFVSCHVQQLLHHGGMVGEIQELFVRVDQRGQGIGQQLVDALYVLAQRDGWINLEVTTNLKRQDTIRFYQRERFTLSHAKLVRPIQP